MTIETETTTETEMFIANDNNQIVPAARVQAPRWFKEPPTKCQVCEDPTSIQVEFVDGYSRRLRKWCIQCYECHYAYGIGLGIGRGQHYRCTPEANGLFLKVTHLDEHGK